MSPADDKIWSDQVCIECLQLLDRRSCDALEMVCGSIGRLAESTSPQAKSPLEEQEKHYSIFGRRVPAELRPYEFPVYRQLFLMGAVLWYFVDVGLDLFVAGTYLEAHLSGRDSHALSYFIATMAFLVVPSALVQLQSWLLYFWSYHVCGNQGPFRLFRKFCHAPHQSGGCVALACSDTGACDAEKLLVAPLPRARPRDLPIRQEESPFPTIYLRGARHQTREQQSSCHPHPRLSPHVVSAPFDESSNLEQVDGQEVRQDGVVCDSPPPNLSPSADTNPKGEHACYCSHTPHMIDGTGPGHALGESTDGGTSFYPLDCLSRLDFVTVTSLHVLQLAFPVRAVRLLWFCTRDPFSYFRYKDISFLRLMEAFLESGSQAVLQLYLMQVQEEPVVFYRIITPLSILSSFVGLALAAADFASAGKDILAYFPISCLPGISQVKKDEAVHERMSWTVYFVVIFWHLCIISARGLAVSFFAAGFRGYVFVILAVHYVVMVWWMYRETGQMYLLTAGDEGKPSRMCWLCDRYLIEFIVAGINMFFYFSVYDDGDESDNGAPALKYITAYHILVFVENVVMTLMWFAVVDLEVWYSYVGLAAVFVLYGMGLGFMCLYYRLPSPENKAEGQVWDHFHCHGHVGKENLRRVQRFTSTLNWFFDHNRVAAEIHAHKPPAA